MRVTWDIFCSVIDYFGDIGVTWRLARQLVAEHDQEVRLWVDDMNAFCRLCPEANAKDEVQVIQGLAIHHWPHEWQPVQCADVVIEAFGCQLPPAYIEAMVKRSAPPLWLNLEYLSAEDWVEGCHGLPSPQRNGLQKFFFFPGFTPQTGGLLRETGLIEQRQRFQQ
ncbi:MAG: elongation factor P maturation arginine rhamnosyltransferase EarP, partial [Gammaproteobacteria bacterium]|nr:elongation factor P maturation arginine rhamnosyltransferase EarP [Gammaproteobacteria bacterium]